jgi:hypothetical protein
MRLQRHLAGGPNDDESLIGRSNLANANARAGHARRRSPCTNRHSNQNPVVSANASSSRAS